MHILLTNDDGIHSPGIKSLAQALLSLGSVTVVAPASEQSGISHALTFRTPLFVRELAWDNGMTVWAVEGTPADCTRFGILNLCQQRPDIVVSGINHGFNIGSNIIYSGTVAGAEEGAILGIDSFAVSLEWDAKPPWEKASALVTQVIRQIVRAKVSSDLASLININVPLLACFAVLPAEVCVVPVDQTPLTDAYLLRQNPHGEPYYWLTGHITPSDPGQSTDRIMVKKGYITVTPLEYNRTNRTAIEKLELAFDNADNELPIKQPLDGKMDVPANPFVRRVINVLPKVPTGVEGLSDFDDTPDDLPLIRQGDTTDADVSHKPAKGKSKKKKSTDKSSPHSEGT